MKALGGAMVIMVLMLPSVLWGKGVSRSSLDFAVKKSVKLRCDIDQHSHGPWYLRVIAENSNKRSIFSFLYSVRKDLKASKQDCEAWIKAVNKQRDRSWAQQTAHVNGTDSPRTKHRHGK